MVKKVSLNIPDDNYEKLASLSDFYNQDVEDTITNILDAVSMKESWIIHLSKEYKVQVKLVTVISRMFYAGIHVIRSLFNEFLEKLEVKGLYTIDDFDIDVDLDNMWFLCPALPGCNLQIEEFHLEIHPGLKYLDTKSYIDVENIDIEKVNSKALGKLLKLVRSVEVPEESDLLFEYKIEIREELEKIVRSVEVPEEFDELEEYKIEIEEDEEPWTLKIDCVADSLNYLPSVKRISEFVEQVFKKAGIEYAHE